nr:hypothetical protein [Spirochaetales bacterium]
MFSQYPGTLALLTSSLTSLDSIWSDDTPLLSDWLQEHGAAFDLPAFIAALARLEEYVADCKAASIDLPVPETMILNPTLQVIESEWLNLPAYLAGRDVTVTAGQELLLVWQRMDGSVRYKSGTKQDLLAMKLVADQTDLAMAAQEHGITVGVLDSMLEHGENEELLLVPDPLIIRNALFKANGFAGEKFLTSPAFTLQWHITQVCDLHCKHCYDRSQRKAVAFDKGVAILDDFRDFCKEHNVFGQVTFTGGNPLLYENFLALYQAAADRGFQL